MLEKEQLDVALTSPALQWRSNKTGKFAYPMNFRNRVPLKVKMAGTVKSDLLQFGIGKKDTVAAENIEYYVWVNSYGAVSAILHNGEKLGLYPSEFDVTEWHK